METTRTAVDQAGEVRGRTNSSTPRPPIAAAAASCQATVTSGRPQRTTDPASAITVGAAAPENASPARHAISAAGTAAHTHREGVGSFTDAEGVATLRSEEHTSE